MSGNTSATGGPLSPTTLSVSAPALTDAMTALVAGVTGLDPTLVRPRWQPTPPPQPAVTVNWCALGLTRRRTYGYPYFWHDPTANFGVGRDDVIRWEDVTFMVSFYGPDSSDLAAILRDALYVPQNWEGLQAAQTKLIEASEVTRVPDLVNQQWVDRADLTILVSREIDRTYAVENLRQAVVNVTSAAPGQSTLSRIINTIIQAVTAVITTESGAVATTQVGSLFITESNLGLVTQAGKRLSADGTGTAAGQSGQVTVEP